MAKKQSKGHSAVTEALDQMRRDIVRPKNMVVVSGSGYHDFRVNPVFQGTFKEKVKAKEANPKYKTKKGDLIGFTFVEKGTKSEKIISNSAQIAKALEDDKFSTKTLWWIEFLEQKKISGGRKVNSFLIGKL